MQEMRREAVTLGLGGARSGLTFFAANLLETSELVAAAKIDHLCRALAASSSAVTLVSKEAGSGVVPAYASGRRSWGLLGKIDERVAQVADTGVLLVAGLPLSLKGSASAAEGSR